MWRRVLAFLDRIDARGSDVERGPGSLPRRCYPVSARPPTHLVPVNHVGPLERARQLEGLGFLGISLQPLGLDFQSAWKLIS